MYLGNKKYSQMSVQTLLPATKILKAKLCATNNKNNASKIVKWAKVAI